VLELKKQDPVIVLLLTIITCGIYGLYYYYIVGQAVNRELNREACNPVFVWLGLITCGITLLIYLYQLDQALLDLGRKENIRWNSNFIMWIVLNYIFGIGSYIALWQIQSFINTWHEKFIN